MHWLAEGYLARTAAEDVAAIADRARAAAEALVREGQAVQHVHSAFVPEDEVCLHLFEGSSAAAVAEALSRASLACDRIVAARAGGATDGVREEPPQVHESTTDQGEHT